MNNIVFENVHKSYGHVEVIRGLNLEIPEGERVILLGPSGCGKSTILRMIAGLEDITAGDLFMSGRRVNDVDPGDRNVAMVFQSYALYPHMTVEKNIYFGMEIAKLPKEEREERTSWALNVLNLAPYRKRFPKELSGGQRQRVALCRALVKKAPYFLLDEPLSNLDAQLRTNARAELVRIHEVYHPTFIYVTHDQVEAMTVGQRIVVLDKSIIQQQGTPDDIYNRPKNVFVAKFIGSPSMNVGLAKVDGDRLIIGESSVEIPAPWRAVLGERPEVRFGFRPEHTRLSESGGDLPVTITYVENHGNRKCITFSMGGNPFMATTDPDFTLEDDMRLSVNWNKMHFFDAETEESLGYPANV